MRLAAQRPSWPGKAALPDITRQVESATVIALMGQLAEKSRDCGAAEQALVTANARIAVLEMSLQAERERKAPALDEETCDMLKAIQSDVAELKTMEMAEEAAESQGEVGGDDREELARLASIESMLQQLLAREQAEMKVPELGEMRFEFIKDAANLPVAVVYKP